MEIIPACCLAGGIKLFSLGRGDAFEIRIRQSEAIPERGGNQRTGNRQSGEWALKILRF
jgi:hypothetical protein